MKKLMLFLLVGILLVGGVYAGITLSKDIEVKKEYLDTKETFRYDSYTYDGKERVCLFVNNETVERRCFSGTTEQIDKGISEYINNYLAIKSAGNTKERVEITKTSGEIILKEQKAEEGLGGLK